MIKGVNEFSDPARIEQTQSKVITNKDEKVSKSNH